MQSLGKSSPQHFKWSRRIKWIVSSFLFHLLHFRNAVNILKYVMHLLLAECKSRGSRVHTGVFPQERTGLIANVDWLTAHKPHITVAACPMTIKLFRRTIAPAPKRTNTHRDTHVNTVFTKFYCCRQIGHVLAVKTGLCSRLLAVGNQNGGGCVEGVGTGSCCEVMQSQHGPPGGIHEWARKQRQNQ